MTTRQQKLFGAFLEFLAPEIADTEAGRAAVWGAAAAFWGKLEPALHKRGLSIRSAFGADIEVPNEAIDAACRALGDDGSRASRDKVVTVIGSALPLLRERPSWSPTHTHRKTQKQVRVVAEGLIEASMTPSVIYEEEDGTLWVRPTREFNDGRFEPIKVDLFAMEERPSR